MSAVFRTIDPPPPSLPRECVLLPHQRRGRGEGGTHSPGGEGVGGSIFRKMPNIGWPLQYNPSTYSLKFKENIKTPQITRTVYDYDKK